MTHQLLPGVMEQINQAPQLRGARPRRASRQWMEQAPPYVLSCHDLGEKSKFDDRYTVLYWSKDMVDQAGFAYVECLGMSGAPTHPQGVSMFGQLPRSSDRPAKRVRWLDLPRHIRQHAISRWYDGEENQRELVLAGYKLYTPGNA